MKSYDEFPGISDDEIEELLNRAANAIDLDMSNNDQTAIPVSKLPYLIGIFSSMYSDNLLRKYHEWLSEQL